MPEAMTGRSWGARLNSRWVQLILGVIAMMAISSPQYVWTLFVKPLQSSVGGGLAVIQVTFAILVVLQTWLSPMQGYLIERFGPRKLISVGAILTGSSWIFAAYAHDILSIYLSYGVLGGIGTGIIYVGIVGLMVRWFPDRRGMAAGMVAAGYGFGAAITTFPISVMITKSGYEYTLIIFGLLLGGITLLAAQGLRLPPAGFVQTVAVATVNRQNQRNVGPGEMLKTPIFWLLFFMMVLMSTGGLMVISQMGAFAADFGVAKTLVFGFAALPLALTLDRLTNGFTRPFFGWISDHIGRENTMGIAFLLEAMAIFLLFSFHSNAAVFVVLTGLVFFGWGEIFSLFPSTLTDTFGTEHATTNYGFLYMAQGVGSVLGGPLAALLHESTGSWMPVFAAIIVLDTITAILAFLVLKPMRQRWLDRVNALATRAIPANA